MNRGDAGYLTLDITINGSAITADYADDIEITFNSAFTNTLSKQTQIRKTLKDRDVIYDSTLSKFKVYLSQEDTFSMNAGENTWHLRVSKGNTVISSDIGKIIFGNANSGVIL